MRARALVIRDGPLPSSSAVRAGTIELIRGGERGIGPYTCRLNGGAPHNSPAIEQSRADTPGATPCRVAMGGKSRLFSATEPFLCFPLELRFAIKSPVEDFVV